MDKILLLGSMGLKLPIPETANELREIKRIFDDFEAIDAEFDATVDQASLRNILRDYANKTLILHFSGHSDGRSIQVGDSKVYTQHIAKIISTWDIKPMLVFINGCSSAGQSESFLEAGVVCVVATKKAIGDNIAKEFAINFYREIASDNGQLVLSMAFDRASSTSQFLSDGNPRSIVLDDLPVASNNWDWGIFCKDPLFLARWTLSNPARGANIEYVLKRHSTFGLDEYGKFADLKIAKTIQRIRLLPPNHPSIADNLWLSDCACTQELWLAVMGSNPSHFKISLQHPVERISYSKIQLFLGELEELIPELLFRLPSCELWDYACKAYHDNPNPNFFAELISPEQVCFESKTTARCKSLPPNNWGFYEMLGNVWEWCDDDADESGRTKVLKGGSWADASGCINAEYEGRSSIGNRDYTIGFRFSVALRN